MTLEQQLEQWLVNFVEVPHHTLGNWPPCPYARHARLDNKIAIVHSAFGTLVNDVNSHLNLLDTKDVIIIMFDHTQVPADLLISLVKSLNRLLMPQDYVILEDHPDAAEFVSGVHMNFGHCGLLVVQHLSKLNKAADQLQLKGYYEHWDNQTYEDVVAWRYQ